MSDYIIETIETENYKLEISQDEGLESPRDWDNLGTITAWHRRYNLSDDGADFDSYRSFLEYHADRHFKTQEGLDNASDERLMELMEKDYIVMTVHMYEHGQIALSTSSFMGRAIHAEWDSGRVGFIYVSKEKVKQEYGGKVISKKLRERVEGYLTGEIEVYSNYVNGDIVCYTLFNKDDEEQDSCGGFFGYNYKTNGIAEYVPQEVVMAL